MSRTLVSVGAVLVLAVTALSGATDAQQKLPGGAAAAPRISAPAAPRISAPAAPHINAAPAMRAPPMTAASRFSAPIAPRAGVARGFSAPRGFAARTFSRPAFRGGAVGGSFTRQAFRGRATGRSLTRPVPRGRLAGRAISRQALRSGPTASRTVRAGGGGLSRTLAQSRHARTQTSAGLGRSGRSAAPPFGRGTLGSRAAQPALGGPLGARNRNFADRRRFFDERRRFHHGGFIGWLGPVFWPYAYDDFFDYAFWPGEYDDYAFWPQAYDGLIDGVFWAPGTGPIYASLGGSGEDRAGGRASGRGRGAPRGGGAAPPAAQLCSATEPGLTQWPVEEIEKVVQPTRDQGALLADLRAAADQAAKVLQSACPSSQPATPLGRLDAVAQRLDAMLRAVDIVRPALARFYDSLDDEQKARFNATGQEANRSEAGRTGNASQEEAQVCSGRGAGFTDEAIRRIEQALRPRGAQRDALDALKDASAQAVETLRAACPDETPLTPVGRLDAMAKRLQAMLDAVRTVRPALAKFYASLSDEQKARFNVLRPQQG